MTKNERLQEIVLEELCEFLKTNNPKTFNGLNDYESIDLLSQKLKLEFDEEARFAIRFGDILIKGYDLRKNYEEEPAARTFVRALRNVIHSSGKGSFPTFVFAGIRSQYGFYIVKEANGKRE